MSNANSLIDLSWQKQFAFYLFQVLNFKSAVQLLKCLFKNCQANVAVKKFNLKMFLSVNISQQSVNFWCSSMAHNDRALCRCGIRIPSARNHCPAFDKDKY